ncbi:hypothetical protein VNI00_013443 [Paramarasmius palmivorus]|uniref:C2H2-type domain-containing protein n=1 Tax=Paramarasmius palmivorus TaxID=297713 RepID=A0AAW0BZ13_9AGAR
MSSGFDSNTIHAPEIHKALPLQWHMLRGTVRPDVNSTVLPDDASFQMTVSESDQLSSIMMNPLNNPRSSAASRGATPRINPIYTTSNQADQIPNLTFRSVGSLSGRKAAESRRKNRARFFCNVGGCSSSFTQRHNLKRG